MKIRAGCHNSAMMAFCAPLISQTQSVQSYDLNAPSKASGRASAMLPTATCISEVQRNRRMTAPSVLKYDPRTQQITFLAYDLTTICHKDPQTNPQGKLHSDIVEANGWLYMSNQFGSALLSSYPAWSGLHVIGYQLATGQFRDYGVNSGYWNKLLPAAPCSHWPVNWWCSPIGQDLPRRSGLRCYGRDLCNMTTTNLSTNGGRITG